MAHSAQISKIPIKLTKRPELEWLMALPPIRRFRKLDKRNAPVIIVQWKVKLRSHPATNVHRGCYGAILGRSISAAWGAKRTLKMKSHSKNMINGVSYLAVDLCLFLFRPFYSLRASPVGFARHDYIARNV